MSSGLGDLLGGLLGGSGGGALGGVLGKLAGGGSPMIRLLMPALMGLLASGGLESILSRLKASGLGSQADSWIGTGPNQAVTGEQLRDALGVEQISEIAQKLGVSPGDAAHALAEVLPQLVDHVTPDGKVPAEHDLAGALDQLRQAFAPQQ